MIYTEEVTRLKSVTEKEFVEAPEALIKLVNSNDKEFGRNGYHYMGCQRKQQGGLAIDRVYEYISHHNIYHIEYGHPCNCPVKL